MSTEPFELLFEAVNEQGYLFQGACEQELRDKERRIGWEVIASEYSVPLQGQDTRIDIVLRSKISSSPELYAVVECKRADPSYIYWVFGANGFPFGDASCSALGIESPPEIRSAQPYEVKRLLEQLPFNFVTSKARNWLEAKRGSSGRVSTPQNIENAFLQVLKGVGGLAQEQIDQRRKSNVAFKAFFIPVVVTTADVYVAEYNPYNINLSTGKIPRGHIHFDGTPGGEGRWVQVDYCVGENVAPKPIPESFVGVDPAELQKYKMRSIFVVNSSSLITFFSKLKLAQ